MNNDHKMIRKNRNGIVLLLVLTTAVFFAVLSGLLYLNHKKPDIQRYRIEASIAKGNTDKARTIAGRLSDSDTAQHYEQQCDYLDGVAYMEIGNWEAAVDCLTATGGFKNAKELIQECEYRIAVDLLEEGKFAEASTAFHQLDDYRDSTQRYAESIYKLALQLEQQGDGAEAAMLFQQLPDYQDARDRAEAIAVKITGIADGEVALASLSGLSAEDISRIEELEQLRAQWPQGIIDLGFHHTVGLKSDGSAIACGDDTYSQCQVSGWTDIREISAGAYHTVGLCSDGTVVAVGRNDEKQCNVSGWTNIVAVTAADYATYGLCADGSIVCTGDYSQTETEQWKNISVLRAGSYAVAGLSIDGRIRIHPEPIGTSQLEGITEIALNTGYAVGLNRNGTVLATAFELGDWSDIVRISASSTCVLGLDREGHIVSEFFRESDRVDFSNVENAVAICAGGTHFAVVYDNGQVEIFGDKSWGQADTAEWDLFD